ncbi:MAG: hypothetical protein MI757_08025, partial [Pirellulales bacterium]|nr:hypothetical protein [Pirellulales bacterium]
ESCTERESYSLSAGLALGMITFGLGPELVAGPLADLELPDVLQNYMVGGPRRPQRGATAVPAIATGRIRIFSRHRRCKPTFAFGFFGRTECCPSRRLSAIFSAYLAEPNC